MADPLRPWERRNGARVSLASDALQRALGTSLAVPAAPTAPSTTGSPSNGAIPAVVGRTPTPPSTLGSPFAYTGTYGSTTPFGALPRYEHRTITSSAHPSALADSSASTPTFQRYPTRRPSPSGWYPQPTGPTSTLTGPSPSEPRARSLARSFRLRPSPPVLAAYPHRTVRTPSPSLPRSVPAVRAVPPPQRAASPPSDPFRLRPSLVLPRAFVFTTTAPGTTGTTGTTQPRAIADQPNTSRARAPARSPVRGRSPPRLEAPYTPPRQIRGAALRGSSSGDGGDGYGHGAAAYSPGSGEGGFWDSVPVTVPELTSSSGSGGDDEDEDGEWWDDVGF